MNTISISSATKLAPIAASFVESFAVGAEELACGPHLQVVHKYGAVLRNINVAACVAASDSVREAGLLEFCRQRLSGWQVPKRIFFVEEIPVNERGKISRRELAQRFSSR